ncbi:LytR C-terminal domain-containing protein [Euzebya tangerina]|uniref:LytR C-terminal domain-containing protein n=1 Tax=Euzebya tangerina TaxID=591198 RepID=UPI000E315F64|nr:LytR C-terminal domain-containing protein [Euzebya tangerina]
MSTILRLISLNAARVLFVGSLLLALYVGLTWALAIEDRPDAASIARAEAAANASESERTQSEVAAAPTPEAVDPSATAEPTEAPPTVDPQELIAAALPPGDTTVQILDAGGGSAAVDAAASVLEQLGYNIVARASSGRDVSTTTVYFTADNEAEAEALRARDPRFQVVEPNRGLNESVNIHVLVGSF